MKSGDTTGSTKGSVQRLLRNTLAQRRERNPAYSLRAFAKSLRMEASAVSELMNGKRLATLPIALRIADALALSPAEREALLSQAVDRRRKDFRRASLPLQSVASRMQLSQDQYQTIAEWQHFAILSLAETEGFRSDPEWIAGRLGLTKSKVEASVRRLVRLEMLREENGQLEPTGLAYATPDEIRDASVRSGHFQNLDLARASLENDELSARDFGAMTMSIDPDLLPEAKRRIREFRRELSAFLESGRKREVYKVCLQLFPLTKAEGKNK